MNDIPGFLELFKYGLEICNSVNKRRRIKMKKE
jgi:hypothetical protein